MVYVYVYMFTSQVSRNLSLAFRLAEECLGVSPLLEVEDLVTARPDKLSVLTYLAQFYHALGPELQQLPGSSEPESDSGVSSVRSSLTSSSRSLTKSLSLEYFLSCHTTHLKRSCE